MPSEKPTMKLEQQIFRGIPVSSGIVIGKAYLFQRQELEIDRYFITPAEVPGEIDRFRKGLNQSKGELKKIREKISQELGKEHSYIIDTHLLILEDSMLIDGVIQRIERDMVNAESALEDVLETFNAVFRKLEDEYLRERHSDVEDVIHRIMRKLVGHRDLIKDIPTGAIVIAHDLSPSETAQMESKTVRGFATDRGGKTSHTAIMARSMGIGAVVGLVDISRKVTSGTEVILDGNAGTLIMNPDKNTILEYRNYQKKYKYYENELVKIKDMPAVTTDGRKISLMANIELPQEVSNVLIHGGEGIGLYRTEFLYINRSDVPTEEEHFKTYKKLTKSLRGRSATIRTLDLGGDKYLSQIPMPREINPALGLRAIRLCLKQVDVFKDQLCGILRASHYGKLKIMFPMISGLEELRQAKKILEEVKNGLRAKGIPFDEGIEVGTMIETPSAVTIADLLADETDFFSIGTNDLIQYSLAIDRINQDVAYLYKPLHPAVLRNIKLVVDTAHERGIHVAMCGEMAGEPIYSTILIGLGLTELSMNSAAIPRVKKIIRSISMEKAVSMAEGALRFSTVREVEDYLTREMVNRFPADITADGRQICLL